MAAKRSFPRVLRTVLLLGLGLLLAACAQAASPVAPTAAPTEAAPPEPTLPPEPAGDPVRGGLLYDQWWDAIGGEAPEGDQALWSTQTTNTRSGAETWRCKECHGWDYQGADGAYGSGSHFTGFPGVFGVRDLPTAELVAILKGSTNPDHDFSDVMDDQDLTDLALFITQALTDDADFVNADGSSKGEAAAGQDRYEEVCTYCHGPDGNAINFDSLEEPEFLGHVAGDNPWEFIHKVRFGQPGWPMPSSIANAWTDQEVANVLAYGQTLPTEPMVSGGGLLYDAWWEVSGAEAPTTDQPLWQTQTTNTRTGADTWRCKECHGWDYKGVDGAYGSGSHKTGFIGVMGVSGMDPNEILGTLIGFKNPMHDFSTYMDNQALIDLALF